MEFNSFKISKTEDEESKEEKEMPYIHYDSEITDEDIKCIKFRRITLYKEMVCDD